MLSMTQTDWINTIEGLAAMGLVLLGLGATIAAINALWRTITGKPEEYYVQKTD